MYEYVYVYEEEIEIFSCVYTNQINLYALYHLYTINQQSLIRLQISNIMHYILCCSDIKT